jgi:hypothetical protein
MSNSCGPPSHVCCHRKAIPCNWPSERCSSSTQTVLPYLERTQLDLDGAFDQKMHFIRETIVLEENTHSNINLHEDNVENLNTTQIINPPITNQSNPIINPPITNQLVCSLMGFIGMMMIKQWHRILIEHTIQENGLENTVRRNFSIGVMV